MLVRIYCYFFIVQKNLKDLHEEDFSDFSAIFYEHISIFN